MSYFSPHLIPGHQMIDALISPDEFYSAIKKLEPRIAAHLIYVRDHNSVIVDPLRWLATVEAEAKKAKKTNPKRAEYLNELAREWASIIARAAIEHHCWRDLFSAIPRALKGELPKSPPAWTEYFHRTLVTGDDNTVHVPSYPTLTAKATDGGQWEASAEPAKDLYNVLKALGYPPRPLEKRGPKPKGKCGAEPN